MEQEKYGLREELVRVEQEKMEIDSEKMGMYNLLPDQTFKTTMYFYIPKFGLLVYVYMSSSANMEITVK